MSKKSGGGGGSNLFTTNVTNDTTVGTLAYVLISSIPVGLYIWFGTGQYASPDKSITVELRTNKIGFSDGNDGSTVAIAGASSVSPRSGQLTIDYYRNGRLTTKTVTGTGIEKVWLKLSSKGATGSFLYSLNFTST